MKKIALLILLFPLFCKAQNKFEYTKCIKLFYSLLYKDRITIYEFSKIYAQSVKHMDADMFIQDSLESSHFNRSLINDFNRSLIHDRIIRTSDESSSYVFEKMKKYFNELTFGYSLEAINNIIDSSEVYDEGYYGFDVIELSFSNDKKVYFFLNILDSPPIITFIWLNNGDKLEDLLLNIHPPSKALFLGIIDSNFAFEPIRKGKSKEAKIVGKFKKNELFYYVPDNTSNWWRVIKINNKKGFDGYIEKSSVVKYAYFPEKLKTEAKKIMSK